MAHRYALVTAGAQGLGQAIVQYLVQQHYRVFLHYYTSHQAAVAMQKDIAAAGGHVILLQADLSRTDERQRLLAGVASVWSVLLLMVL
jgi:3-oxoacyl-[acyl-carrier protein] reductase